MGALLPVEAAGRAVRCIPEAGARWRRRFVEAMLRFGIRRRLGPEAGIDHLRAVAERMDSRFGATERDVRRTPVDAGGVAAEWIDVVSGGDAPVIVYLHGGAFCLRFPCTHAALVARLCRRLGARALLPDYRLAPEHRYPAALDDCVKAYRFALAQCADPKRIVLAGDSAGGTLVLAALLRLKASALPLPACAVAISPLTDFTLSGRSMVDNEGIDPMFRLRVIAAMRTLYADAVQFTDPFVSPLFGAFHGLPPLLLQVGSTEMLRDDALRFAARAQQAGVDAEVEVYENMPHVFHVMRMLPASDKALDAIADFVRARTGRFP